MTDTTTDPVARAAALLKGHRESIDRLDAILVYTLGERFKHTQAVGQLKATHDLPRPIPRVKPRRSLGSKNWRKRPIWTLNLPRRS